MAEIIGKNRYNMTKEEHKQLGDKLQYLKNVRVPEVEEQLRVARSFGDLSENSEYEDAKNQQGKLNSEILDLEDLYDNANIIELSGRLDVAGIGRKVTVQNIASKQSVTYEIVSSQSVNPLERKISDSSPLGRALVDRKVGDIVEYDAPAGKYAVEILEII